MSERSNSAMLQNGVIERVSKALLLFDDTRLSEDYAPLGSEQGGVE